MSKRRKKSPGHYCWCCGRRRANELFSGRGHRQHLCKDCKKLGQEELAYRQQERNIDRLLTWDGMIRRRCRVAFERYLAHPDPRVREYADKVQLHNEERRREWRQMRLERYRDEDPPDDGSDGKDEDDLDSSAWESEETPY